MPTHASARLSPDRAQLVFRAVLDALARPGSLTRLPDAGGLPPALLPALALADLDTPVYVRPAPGDATDWADQIRTATSAPAAPLETARIVTFLTPPEAGALTRAHPGRAEEPEAAALVVCAVTDLPRPDAPGDDPGQVWELTGPGVPGTRRVTGLPPGLAAERTALGDGHPVGIDLVFVSEAGELLALPRSARLAATTPAERV